MWPSPAPSCQSPRLLLLDEPLSNLDAKLRVDMRSELKRLHHDTGSTIIYVTHDQVEALTMSTKIALFREGELVQVDKPLELYDNPLRSLYGGLHRQPQHQLRGGLGHRRRVRAVG